MSNPGQQTGEAAPAFPAHLGRGAGQRGRLLHGRDECARHQRLAAGCARLLGATFEEGSWITTAYLVAEIIIIPMTGWLVSVFSMRRVMMVGTAGFVLFSIACSLAPNIQTMIIARTLQGAFGGVLIPLSFQLIVTELPAARHPMGMALFAVANNVAQAAGPSLGAG